MEGKNNKIRAEKFFTGKLFIRVSVAVLLCVALAAALSAASPSNFSEIFFKQLFAIAKWSVIILLLYLAPPYLIRTWQKHRKTKKGLQKSPADKAVQRFLASTPALLGSITLLYAIFIMIFVHLLAPDVSPHANEQMNELSFKPPGYTITVLRYPLQKQQHTNLLQQLLHGKENSYKEIPVNTFTFRNDSVYVERYIGDNIPGQQLSFFMQEITGLKIPADENATLIQKKYLYEKKFYFGTDDLGRDYLSRILLGVRVSLAVGFVAVIIALCIGVPIGAAAGFYKSKPPGLRISKKIRWKIPVDAFIMWCMNVIWAIPTLLLVFPIVFAFGQNFYTIYIAVGLTLWVDIARIVRGQVMQVREMEYIQAANTFGFSHFRTIFRHILPNITGPVIVITAANFAYAILIEAGLSFLGIGVQPPAPSWGLMLSKYKDNLITDPYLALIPGLAITILVLAFFMVGNGLRDALDVKTRIEN